VTDPANAMKLFQEALLAGHLPLRQGSVDRSLYLAVDKINDNVRFTYLRLNGKVITAFVSFVTVEPIDDLPCFQVGYAVPEEFRGLGRATDIVRAATTELVQGFGRAGQHDFYIEAVVGTDNPASQKIAGKLIQAAPTPITDCVSNGPALRYLRRVGDQIGTDGNP
jgi:Acetyltransferase (GNAT) domain